LLPDITSKESDLADLGYFGDTLPTGSRDTNDRFSYIQSFQFHDYRLMSPVYCAALLGTIQNNKKNQHMVEGSNVDVKDGAEL